VIDSMHRCTKPAAARVVFAGGFWMRVCEAHREVVVQEQVKKGRTPPKVELHDPAHHGYRCDKFVPTY
jgi:hypothetical protein